MPFSVAHASSQKVLSFIFFRFSSSKLYPKQTAKKLLSFPSKLSQILPLLHIRENKNWYCPGTNSVGYTFFNIFVALHSVLYFAYRNLVCTKYILNFILASFLLFFSFSYKYYNLLCFKNCTFGCVQ